MRSVHAITCSRGNICARVRPRCPVALAVVLAVVSLAAAQEPEFRAMWATRFEWPSTDPNVCRGRIDSMMQSLADAHFNAVFFQVRGQADVLYPSPYEVWSPLIGGTNPGWDPLAYAVNAAHSRGTELHAYINTHPCWASSSHVPPTDPNHLFFKHCNLADPQARDWLHYSSESAPAQFSESDYVWMAPGVPAYQAYIRKQIVYVVQNYAVDGVHYDRIRTPWSNQPSYDPISLARFNSAQSNPNGLSLTAWTADQITRNVRDIYAACMAVNPHLEVSAAVYPNTNTAPTAQHQDALAWAQTGGLDIAVPMMYFTGGSGSTWDTYLQQWLAGISGRHVVAGHSTTQGLSSLLGQIALTRTRGAQGNSVYSWGSFTYWSDYLTNVYANDANQPAMPWKDSPTTGIIYGYITDAGGAQVVDAQITRSGSSYIGLSTGDGFYSFLLVPPGTYTLTVTHPAYTTQAVSGVAVAAGQVVRRDIVLGAPAVPVIAEVTPDPEPVQADRPYVHQLSLASGTVESWTLENGPPGAIVGINGIVSGWTPALADIGQYFAFTVRATNSSGYDDESWSVYVASTPPCTTFRIADFDAYANGARVLFQLPRYSGSTSGDLATTPNVAQVTDTITAYSTPKCNIVQWQYLDTDPQRWLRLTTSNATNIPNPTVELDRPIRVRLRLDSGSLRLAVGLRETGTTADLGADGGTTGNIEWVGAATATNGAPQGKLVEAMPGVWQTFIFDPRVDPILGMTGDGVLYTTNGQGVLEHLAFSVVDSVGPFTVYIDNVDLLCESPVLGDVDSDGDADPDDFELLADCMRGPDVAPLSGCVPADLDSDVDVDLADFAAFQFSHTGG